jgi:hypothetical protein
MQYGITIKHRDHAFVEQHGGWEFLSHLRAGPSRAAYRRRALLHAMQAYRRILVAGGAPEELCGAALLVVQRGAFCAEDLAGLLHALSDSTDRWARLTSSQIPHLDAVCRQVAKDACALGPVRARPSLKAFCIGPDELIERESGLSAEQRAASVHLAELYAARWLKRMRRVALFWSQYRELAKATMHGYPLLAGRRVVGPPPAGRLAEGRQRPGRPIRRRAQHPSAQAARPGDQAGTPGELGHGVQMQPAGDRRCPPRGTSRHRRVRGPLQPAGDVDPDDRRRDHPCRVRAPAPRGRTCRLHGDHSTVSWASQLSQSTIDTVMLPNLAYLRSARDQTLPARKLALSDATGHFTEAEASGDAHWCDLALLGVIGEAMQILEDLVVCLVDS